jgi:hypothetical protein
LVKAEMKNKILILSLFSSVLGMDHRGHRHARQITPPLSCSSSP